MIKNSKIINLNNNDEKTLRTLLKIEKHTIIKLKYEIILKIFFCKLYFFSN